MHRSRCRDDRLRGLLQRDLPKIPLVASGPSESKTKERGLRTDDSRFLPKQYRSRVCFAGSHPVSAPKNSTDRASADPQARRRSEDRPTDVRGPGDSPMTRTIVPRECRYVAAGSIGCFRCAGDCTEQIAVGNARSVRLRLNSTLCTCLANGEPMEMEFEALTNSTRCRADADALALLAIRYPIPI